MPSEFTCQFRDGPVTLVSRSLSYALRPGYAYPVACLRPPGEDARRLHKPWLTGAADHHQLVRGGLLRSAELRAPSAASADTALHAMRAEVGRLTGFLIRQTGGAVPPGALRARLLAATRGP